MEYLALLIGAAFVGLLAFLVGHGAGYARGEDDYANRLAEGIAHDPNARAHLRGILDEAEAEAFRQAGREGRN